MRHMDTCLFKQKASRRKGVAFGSYTSKVFGAGQQTSVRLSQSKLHFFHSTSAVTLMNKQLGTWKTPFGLRLRLIQNANSRLRCCQHSSLHPWLMLSLLRLQLHTSMWTCCTVHACESSQIPTQHIPVSKLFYLLPISSVSKGREKPGGKRSCCWLCQLGASCPDTGPSRDIPEWSCWNRGRGQLGVSFNAGHLNNLIWFEVGMHPQIGPRLRASVASVQSCRLQ